MGSLGFLYSLILFAKDLFKKIRGKFEPSADHHRHLILWNGCSHSDIVLRPTLTVTSVWNTRETGEMFKGYKR